MEESKYLLNYVINSIGNLTKKADERKIFCSILHLIRILFCYQHSAKEVFGCYRVFQRFGQAKFTYGESILGSSRFTQLLNII